MQEREHAEELIEKAVEEGIQMDLAWQAADALRRAIVLTRDKDVTGEAVASSMCGPCCCWKGVAVIHSRAALVVSTCRLWLRKLIALDGHVCAWLAYHIALYARHCIRALSLCRLGRLYAKVLQDKVRAFAYYKTCLEQAHSLVPIPVYKDWFKVGSVPSLVSSRPLHNVCSSPPGNCLCSQPVHRGKLRALPCSCSSHD